LLEYDNIARSRKESQVIPNYSNTGQMKWISMTVSLWGVFVYAVWSGVGVLIDAIGLAGLVWCFLRR
jgi:hypothetical protein